MAGDNIELGLGDPMSDDTKSYPDLPSDEEMPDDWHSEADGLFRRDYF